MSPLSDFGIGVGAAPRVFHKAGRKQLLREFLARGYRTGAEIGVWRGQFSELMCQAIPGLQLRCVDGWGLDPTYHKALPAESWEKLRIGAATRLTPYGCVIDVQHSVDAAKSVPDGSLDFVYIDGNHGRTQVYADLTAWSPKVRAGGMVTGHDYRHYDGRPDIQVKAAVDAFVRDRKIQDWCVLSRDRNPSFCWMVP